MEGPLKANNIPSLDIPSEVAGFIASHRVARLATADAEGVPHAVPICYAFDGKCIYTALDLKPKRIQGRALKRVRNILQNPKVSLVIDDYSEDWSELAYVQLQGNAHLVDDGHEQKLAEVLLREKYHQYETLLESGCTVIKITPTNVVSWGQAR